MDSCQTWARISEGFTEWSGRVKEYPARFFIELSSGLICSSINEFNDTIILSHRRFIEIGLKTICLVYDQDTEIDPGKIVRSFLHLNETNGVLLVGCTNCCRSLKLPSNVPTNGEANVEEWATKQSQSNSWLECIPLLEEQLVKEPNGVNDYQGEKVYTPGADTEHLRKYPYMYKYGVDPECMWAKMKGGNEQKPFVIK